MNIDKLQDVQNFVCDARKFGYTVNLENKPSCVWALGRLDLDQAFETQTPLVYIYAPWIKAPGLVYDIVLLGMRFNMYFVLIDVLNSY